jgi:hypothetical protein
MHRFKLGPNDPYYRYDEDGILYTASAFYFSIEQIENAFDKGLFEPMIDPITHDPNKIGRASCRERVY